MQRRPSIHSSMESLMNLQSTLRSTLAGALLLLAAGSMSACAAQAVPVDVAWRKVSYSDLDIARSEGAERLYSRIAAAARDVCRQQYGWAPFAVISESRCASASISPAVGDVGGP